MAIEIERKFLVVGDAWRASVTRTELLRQGYAATSPGCSVRVRLMHGTAWLGLKAHVHGATRLEYEYRIPPADGEEILERLCRDGRVEKYRHWLRWADHDWEVDEFLGGNAGLVVAELELDREDEAFAVPPWLGAEVTEDERYYNSSLARCPYSSWDLPGATA